MDKDRLQVTRAGALSEVGQDDRPRDPSIPDPTVRPPKLKHQQESFEGFHSEPESAMSIDSQATFTSTS